MCFGNLSALVAGLTIAGLLVWARRPVWAGLLLGAGVLVKPLGVPALAVLLCHRPEEGGRRHLVSAGIALGVAALGLAAWPRWAVAMLYQAPLLHGTPAVLAESTVGLARIAWGCGAALPPWMLTAAATAVACVLVRRRPARPEEALLVASAAAILGAPLVWSHTFVLALPAVALGISRALAGFPAAANPADRRRALATLLWVIVGCVPVLSSDRWSVGDWPRVLQAALAAVPLAALVGLTVFGLKPRAA
jgi:hypothetical protein